MKLDFMKFDALKNMSKPMKIMLLSVGILFGSIFLYKTAINILMKIAFSKNISPIVTVSTGKVTYQEWLPEMKSVGSTRAVLGVNVTAQLSGMIQKVYFAPGSIVQEGDVLVQQNADSNIAYLHSLEANAELARITYDRDKLQYKVHGISKQQLDTDFQNLKSAQAQVAQQASTVNKLTIKAPFSGKLGISRVYQGQYLNPGDPIVTIQQLDTIFVDFYLPQQFLPKIKVGQTVKISIDSYPDEAFEGVISTINPAVDVNSRNVEVEATVNNPKQLIMPGMFVNARVIESKSEKFLTLPQSAVSFNPYGSIVYVVNEEKNKNDDSALTVKQVFVTTGDARGDQVSVLTGLKENDTVVTSGQLKLKNGSRISINNSVQPKNNSNPTLSDEHLG